MKPFLLISQQRPNTYHLVKNKVSIARFGFIGAVAKWQIWRFLQKIILIFQRLFVRGITKRAILQQRLIVKREKASSKKIFFKYLKKYSL
ncbi:MAG: hypothetical protein DRQ06_06600 [Candidatus Hydrothermota bacterium]|nr:MAG: hypothetical protein DRQ06_06600 [Candidatus Hydrothermae bacterium]